MASASHSLSGVSLYEPIHGSAPDIAGKILLIPFQLILSVGVMLTSFGMKSIADQMEAGVLSSDGRWGRDL